jgi:hypothetical protein
VYAPLDTIERGLFLIFGFVMMKRLLDCTASELHKMNKTELLTSIRASEGRVMVSETIAAASPVIPGLTNAELAASQGADLLLLNMFDVENPVLIGAPGDIAHENYIRSIAQLTGRLVGINLELSVNNEVSEIDSYWKITSGRIANAENARRAVDMGAAFVVLTGNPGNGTTEQSIINALLGISDAIGSDAIIIAGKMHAAGAPKANGGCLLELDDVRNYAEAGADVVLIPAPGTVPGMCQQRAQDLVDAIHEAGALAMTAIGTSQEGSNVATIRQIALMSKMAGADLHHIGDTGYFGVAIPDNIREYSIAIRGVRHTYSRIGRSIMR